MPRALDVHLPPEGGSLALGPGQQLFQSLSAGGVLDVGCIPGCAGYIGEAPTLVFDVAADAYGGVGFFFDPEPNLPRVGPDADARRADPGSVVRDLPRRRLDGCGSRRRTAAGAPARPLSGV